MMTDIEIAQKAEMKHIREVAAKLGISEETSISMESIRQSSQMSL